MSTQPNEPAIEVRTIRKGLMPIAYLGIVHFQDEVAQKTFPVEMAGSGSRFAAFAAHNWSKNQAKQFLREAARRLTEEQARLAIEIERARTEDEKRQDAARHAAIIARATVGLRHAMQAFPRTANQMTVSYANVYGDTARCPWS